MSLHVKLIKINFMKKILLIAMLIIVANNVKAYDFEANGLYYDIISLSEMTVALTGKTIENEWGEQEPVVYEGDSDVTIPTTVEYSGKVFTVIEIKYEAFYRANLEKLTIPVNIINADISSTVEKLIIEDSNTPLEDLSVSNAKYVYIGRDIEVPGNHLVYCLRGSGVENVVFGDSVTYIPGGILEGCETLVNVNISNNVKQIFNKAFMGCVNLKSISGEGVEFVETGAFGYCTSLESFNFPNLKIIDDGDSQWGTYRWGVFQGCVNLKNIDLPKGLVKIGTMAFMDCTSLEKISIPASLIHIGEYFNHPTHSSAFSNCPNLKDLYVNSKNPFNLIESTFDSQTYINATLHVPADALDIYRNTGIWNNFFNIVGDSSFDDVCSVMIEGCREGDYDGHVIIGNNEIYSDNYIMSSTIGEKITLKFVPHSNKDEKYELGKVTVNDEDVTSSVLNNELVIEVTGNMIVDVDWDYMDASPILLTIKQAESGCTKLVVDEWETYIFYIESYDGWKLHTVTFNGEDITGNINSDGSLKLTEISEDAVLNVVFESTESAIDNLVKSHVKVYAKANALQIEGADAGDKVMIYTDGGLLVKSFACKSSSVEVPLEHGTYIVKVNDKVIKVLL